MRLSMASGKSAEVHYRKRLRAVFSSALSAIFVTMLSMTGEDLVPPAYAADPTVAQLEKNPSHSVAKLIADVKEFKPGVAFKVGAKLFMQPGWHTYYKDSGDAGMPTKIEWTLPPGFKAGELLWQKPAKFVDAGITTYGYHGPNLTAAEITPPADFKGPVHIKALVKWLCCRDICIPGRAELSITLSPAKGAPIKSEDAKDFDQLGWQGKVTDLTAETEKKETNIAAAVTPGNSNSQGAPPAAPPSNKSGDTADGATGSTAAVNDATKGAADTSLLNEKLDVQGEAPVTLPLCFLLALIGGFILNFMPCVLPVIALKVVGIVEQAHGDHALTKKHALAFTGGMIGTFMVLAGIVIAVQAAGGGVGWGFLFQFPAFLIGMAVVVLLFALSLFGLFYVAVPTGASVDKLASRNDLLGTVFKGVLATLLSTPCTAPFLGTALGFAFTQNAVTIALIFLTIGIGMASPYFLLMLRPDMLKFIPKPGVWMEKFKESMGFVLLATVVWLLYLLGQATGTEGVIRATAFLVGVSFAAWIVSSFTNLSSSTGKKKWHVGSITIYSGTCVLFLLWISAWIRIDSCAENWRKRWARFIGTHFMEAL